MSGWKDGAEVGGGAFFAINHNHQIQDIASPWDDEISSINEKLNGTYKNYSWQGQSKKENQIRQDANALDYNGVANAATRAKSKLSSYYRNSEWDLVDAVEEEEMDLDTVTVHAEYLAPELRDKSREELKAEVERLKNDRVQFKTELQNLIARRDSFVAAERSKDAAAPTSLGVALSKSFLEKLKQ
jgi:acyl-CoA thioesterase FadM